MKHSRRNNLILISDASHKHVSAASSVKTLGYSSHHMAGLQAVKLLQVQVLLFEKWWRHVKVTDCQGRATGRV